MGAARAHGCERRAVRSHPGDARHWRRARRLAAFDRDDRQPATSPCGGLRRVLVASQFAIATPLLIVAGLLVVSLHELARVDLGFDTRNVLTGSILLPDAQYQEPGRVTTFWNELQSPRRSAAWSQRGRLLRRPAARQRGELQQLRSRGIPGTPRRVAAGDAVGGRHARVLQAARVDARRGTAVRRARRAKCQRRIGRRRSRLGETFLPQSERARQTIPGRRLHLLSVDDGGRRRQRREVRGSRQAERRQRLLADGRAWRRRAASRRRRRDSAICWCERIAMRWRRSRACGGSCESSIPASRSPASR